MLIAPLKVEMHTCIYRSDVRKQMMSPKDCACSPLQLKRLGRWGENPHHAKHVVDQLALQAPTQNFTCHLHSDVVPVVTVHFKISFFFSLSLSLHTLPTHAQGTQSIHTWRGCQAYHWKRLLDHHRLGSIWCDQFCWHASWWCPGFVWTWWQGRDR